MNKRAVTIASNLVPFLEPGSRVLEIGAGKGHVARALQAGGQLNMELVDVVDYNETDLKLKVYDGQHLPYASDAFDLSLLVFVLHHTPDPLRLLDEALRVSKDGVVIVENHVQGRLRQLVTRALDSIPHFQHGVPICYHTHTIQEWEELVSRGGIRSEVLSRFTMDRFWVSFVMRLRQT